MLKKGYDEWKQTWIENLRRGDRERCQVGAILMRWSTE